MFLGAFNLLSNGALTARAGTSLIAMTAREYNVPVIVCCETYKFCEKIQADSLVWNEMGTCHYLLTGGYTAPDGVHSCVVRLITLPLFDVYR